MNIFFIDENPIKAARQLCDKHVVKMVLETAQMCSTAMHEWGFARHLKHVYKTAYKNHPMTVWVRDNEHNFAWAVNHGLEIGKEYTRRYGKLHKSTKVLEEMDDGWVHDNYSNHTTPPQCMPDQFKCDDYVEAYRNYYRTDKAHILQWTGRPVPEWIAA
tara:strand:+ start:47 stop:523 length:477 start_codon:yes stop_codon:yes gene_type:complete